MQGEHLPASDAVGGGNSWVCLSPRRRWRVVLMANVPHDQAGRGASFWTAIRSTLLYGGMVDGGSPLSMGKGFAEGAV